MSGWRNFLEGAAASGTPAEDTVATAAPGGLQEDYGFQSTASTDNGWRSFVGGGSHPVTRPQWETGGQYGGTVNAWNTPFYQKMMAQQREASAAGTLGSLTRDENYTGIVMRDGSVDSTGRTQSWGDVYEDGEFKGNLYDRYEGLTQDEADEILGSLVLSKDEQAAAYRGVSGGNANALRDAVSARRSEANAKAEAYESQLDFHEDVEERKDDWGGAAGWGAVLGGAATGVVSGAGLGALTANPLGVVIGGVVGGVAGAIGGALNQDEIVDSAARASVQVERAAETEGGAWAAGSTFLRQWGQTAMLANSPLSNIYKGTYDLSEGQEIGDGVSGYRNREVDTAEDLWNTGGELVAGFGDAVLQFASAPARLAYLGTMGATTVGGVGQITPGLGTGLWDDRSGTFSPPELGEDGQIEWRTIGQAAAAAGVVAIDAVQLGAAGALSRPLTKGLDAVGANTLAEKVARQTKVQVDGRVFSRGEDGKLRSRLSLTLLAPSEAVQWLTVRSNALRHSAGKTAITADDLYAASMRIARQDWRKQALVMGFAEAAEEFVQTGLEPLAHGWTPNVEEMIRAAWMGGVSGAGMALGSRVGRMTPQDAARLQVNQFLEANHLPGYTEEQWSGMSRAQRSRVLAGQGVMATAAEARERAVKGEARVEGRSVSAVSYRNDAIRKEAAKQLLKADPALEKARLISQHDSVQVPSHVVQASLKTTLEILRDNLQGLQDVVENRTTLPKADGTVVELPPMLEAERADAEALAAALEPFLQELVTLANPVLEGTATPQQRVQVVDEVNARLQEAWADTSEKSLSRAVGAVFARDPRDKSGSFQLLLPQVNLDSTEVGADGLLQIGASILKALSGDFDGDTIRHAARMVLREDHWRKARLGLNLLGNEGVDVAVHDYEETTIEDLSLSLALRDAMAPEAEATLNWLGLRLREALKGVVGSRKIVKEFLQSVRDGNGSAKQDLYQALLADSEQSFETVSQRGNGVTAPLSNMFFVVNDVINTELGKFREASADRFIDLDSRDPAPMPQAEKGPAQRTGPRAATMGATMDLTAPGSTPLRQGQSLKYDAGRSATTTSDQNTQSDIQWMVDWHRVLTSNEQRTALEQVYGKDSVVREAQSRLRVLAAGVNADSSRALSLTEVAGMLVPNVDSQGNDFGGLVPAIQVVLREATATFERANARVLDARPELKSKISAYRSMDPVEAFFEVFEATPLTDLMPLVQARKLGAHHTLGSLRQEYLNQNRQNRRIWVKHRTAHGTGYGSGGRMDLPHTAADMEAGRTNGYRIVIDAVTEMVDKRQLSVKDNGSLTGQLADQDNTAITNLENGLGNLVKFVEEFAKDSGGVQRDRDGGLTDQALLSLLDRSRRETGDVWKLIPQALATEILQTAENKRDLTYPQWFFDMLRAKSGKEAAMIYFRHTLLTGIRDAWRQNDSTRRPNDRLVELAVWLSQQQTGVEFAEFELALYNSGSVREFRDWVNKQFPVNQAPQLALIRDTALVDPTETKGGWSRELQSVEDRKTFQSLADKTKRALSDLQQSRALSETNSTIISAVSRALNPDGSINSRSDGAPQAQVLSQRIETLRKITSSADHSFASAPMLAARETVRAGAAATGGFTGEDTDKAAASRQFNDLGQNTALGANLWAEGNEQLFAAFTALGSGELIHSPQALLHPMDIVDHTGKIVKWPGMSLPVLVQMWKQPNLRPLAQAIVFPASWTEVADTGNMQQELLVEGSLQALHDNDTWADALRGSTFNHKARYASILDSISHKYGGDYELTRFAVDIAVTRAHSSRRTLSEQALVQLFEESLQDAVDITRAAAALPPEQRARELQKVRTKLGSGGYKSNLLEAEIPFLTARVETEKLAMRAMQEKRITLAEAQFGKNSWEVQFEQAELQRLNAWLDGKSDVQQFIAANDINWKDETASASKRRALYEYAMLHKGELVKLAGSKHREAILTLLRRTQQQGSIGFPVLAKSEKQMRKYWDQISGLVTQHQLARVHGVGAGQFTEVPLEALDSPLRRYWDSSFGYLLNRFDESSSTLMKSALEFQGHVIGNQTTGVVPEDLSRMIENRLFHDKWQLRWDPTLAGELVAAQTRFDTAGPAAQIARSGKLPTNQQALTGALKLNQKVPTDTDPKPREVVLDAKQLTERLRVPGRSEEEQPTLTPSTQLITRNAKQGSRGSYPAGILDGRFISAASITYTGADGQPVTVNLFPEKGERGTKIRVRPGTAAGRVARASKELRKSGLRITSIQRLRRSLEANVPPEAWDGDVSVSISMYHPEDQPSGPEWANSVVYGGAVIDNAGDVHIARNAAVSFSGAGGLDERGSRTSMDSIKTRDPALRNANIPPHQLVSDMENPSATLFDILTRKSTEMMSRETGIGLNNAMARNQVFERLRLQHVVRGIVTEDGTSRVHILSAEEVIEQQAGDPTKQLTTADGQVLEQPELVKIPGDLMRTLLGEQWDSGALAPITKAPSVHIQNWGAWKGTVPQAKWQEIAPDLFTLSETEEGVDYQRYTIGETSIADIAAPRIHTGRPVLSDSEVTLTTRRSAHWGELFPAVRQSRRSQGAADQVRHFNNTAAALDKLALGGKVESLRPSYAGMQVGFQQMPKVKNVDEIAEFLSNIAKQNLNEQFTFLNGRNAWRFSYKDHRSGGREDGIINGLTELKKTSGNKASAGNYQTAYDMIVIDLGEFEQEPNTTVRARQLREVLEEATSQGLTVALTNTVSADIDARFDAGRTLEEFLYRPTPGLNGVYAPIHPSEQQAQTMEAREQRLGDIELIHRESLVLTGAMLRSGLTENSAMVNPRSVDKEHGREIKVARDLVPVGSWPGFGRPTDPERVQAVKRKLESLNTESGHRFLAEQARLANTHREGEVTQEEIDEIRFRLEKALTVIDFGEGTEDTGTGLPRPDSELETGDFIVLPNGAGDVIIYRHGHDAIPNEAVLNDQLAKRYVTASNTESWGVAIYSDQPSESATTHSMRIERWDPTNLYGLSVVGWMPLPQVGNKTILQRNGFKLLGIALNGEEIDLPDFGPLGDMDIDYFYAWLDGLSKENLHGLIQDARTAIGIIGTDFVPPLAKAIFNVEWDSLDADQQRDYRTRVAGALRKARHALNGETLSFLEVDNAMRDFRALDTASRTLVANIAQTASSQDGESFAFLEKTGRSPEQDIAMAALLYMLTPGAQVEAVLGTSGVGATRTDGKAVSFYPPRVFTAIFDRATPELREWLFDELNRNINKNVGFSGYNLRSDWVLEMRGNNGKVTEMYLQAVEAHSSGDNIVAQAMAQARAQTDSASLQQSAMAQQALWGASSGQGLSGKAERKVNDYINRKGFTQVTSSDDLLKALRGVGKKPPRIGPRLSQQLTPAEELHLERAQRSWLQFQQPINTSKWTKPQQKEFETLRKDVLRGYRLQGHTLLVDTLIRQHTGRPKAQDAEGAKLGNVSFEEAKLALHRLLKNHAEHRMPTYNAKVPMFARDSLQVLFEANSDGGWQPNAEGAGVADGIQKDWNDWVHLALGDALNHVAPAMFWESMDGVLSTYRNQDTGPLIRAVSLRDEVAAALLNPETNELVLALDPSDAERTLNAPLFDTNAAILNDLRYGQTSAADNEGNAPARSLKGRVDRRIQRHGKRHDVPTSVEERDGVVLKDALQKGRHFETESTVSAGFLRVMLLQRQFLGMADPMIWLAGVPEALIKSGLHEAVLLATGESTSNVARRLNKLVPGVASVFSDRVLEEVQATKRSLGNHRDFRSMLNNDILAHPQLADAGWLEVRLHRAVSAVGRLNDLMHGMRRTGDAERYVNGLLRYYLNEGNAAALEDGTILKLVRENPTAFQNAHPEAHRFALNPIANSRGLKQTTASVLMGAGIDRLSASANPLISWPSTLAFKLPYAFQNYAWNLITNLTGAQFLDAVSALVIASANPEKKVGKALTGLNTIQRTMESVDFADAFIKGGMTQTGLLALGLAFGELGLDGEDEEDARLRREAEVQGTLHVYDPRDLANDFRHADDVFLDNVPFLGTLFRTVNDDGTEATSPAEMHWTLKQFISPALGIAKFIHTGNIANVFWGFEDAVGSMPLVNTMLWDDAARVSAELFDHARQMEANASPEELPEAAGFLMNGVWRLERMLFESTFINSIYAAADRYDRDPSTIAEISPDGTIARDNFGEPMDSNALQQYLDNDLVKEGYVKYDQNTATVRTYAENRATLALMGTLFTGLLGGESMLRKDMAIRKRTIQKQALDQESAEALVMSVWDPDNEREVLTEMGGEAVIRGLFAGTVRPGDPALDNVYLSGDQRLAIEQSLMAQLLQEYYDDGLNADEAQTALDQIWYGSETNPWAVPIADVLWGRGKFEDAIPWSANLTYRQLNTTYVVGPGGYPVATGVAREGLASFWGLAPLQRYGVGDLGNLGVDGRLNSVDDTANLNTGRRMLEREYETWDNPTPEDFLEESRKNFQKVIDAINHPRWANSGYTPWNRSGGYGYGRGGGYSSGGGWSFRLNGPERNNPTYNSNIPYVNVDNPYTRRATIRRERFSSTRGRLNQWQ